MRLYLRLALRLDLRVALAVVAVCATLCAQAPSRQLTIPEEPPKPQQPGQPAQQPQTPGQPAATRPQSAPAVEAPRLTETGGFLLPNASLTEMIDILAKRLKINYILDKGVGGTVTIYTY